MTQIDENPRCPRLSLLSLLTVAYVHIYRTIEEGQ